MQEVIALLNSHFIMLSRNLLYTAVTPQRAQSGPGGGPEGDWYSAPGDQARGETNAACRPATRLGMNQRRAR